MNNNNYPVIGIRPVIDGRQNGIRESLEDQTMNMAKAAAELISSNLKYSDGTPVKCVIADSTIGGVAEAIATQNKFSQMNVIGTLTVTPCWCYGMETIDTDNMTIKAVWGFNGTERPGAVYLAAALAGHAQKGLPAFSIYGKDVQDSDDTSIPEDVAEKILRFAKGAVAVGQMKNKSYVNLGGISMGIVGSYCDIDFFQKYLGIRPEFIDLTEILRRINLGIYDKAEFEKALAWTKENCPLGFDKNNGKKSAEELEKDLEFSVKMAVIIKDIYNGSEKLKEMGFLEEAKGRTAIAGGFQGQRHWTDWLPNCDFAEALMNTSFDWNGKREPMVFATENDTLNAVSMMFCKLLTNITSVFADVRTYWSPEAVERVTGKKLEGKASNGFIHLINSGAAALDGTGCAINDKGENCMKPWFDMTDKDIDGCLKATDWCCADLHYFRGGGFSSHFKTEAEMPVTMVRVNLVDGLGPVLQVVEGHTVTLDKEIHDKLDQRTDPTWPTTWFAPRVGGKGCEDVYSVMANWGANHGAFTYGHIGADLITLASMLRIPVSLHNVDSDKIFRPHSFLGFGTKDLEASDYLACKTYGPLYK